MNLSPGGWISELNTADQYAIGLKKVYYKKCQSLFSNYLTIFLVVGY